MTILLACLAAVVSLGSAQIGPPTVDELDVPKYLGRWYQTYASPIVIQTFEKDGFCCTATYGIFNETTLTVYNAQTLFAPENEVDDLEGFAFTTDDPAKLYVSLEGVNRTEDGIPGAPYWVMNLGPEKEYEVDGEIVIQYAYSLVGDPTYLYLFVLVRDVEEFRDLYKEEVLDWLANNGFDNPRNRPIETYHGDNCNYPDNFP